MPEFLRSLRVAEEAQMNNAGILFFARNVYDHLHQAQMTLLAFKGTERRHIYDRRDVRDDLLTQFSVAVAFLKKHLNVWSIGDSGLLRAKLRSAAEALNCQPRVSRRVVARGDLRISSDRGDDRSITAR